MEKKAIFDITVSPKSSQSKIVMTDESRLKVYLNAPPVDGKANKECIALFSKTLRIAKSKITIAKGEKGRNKRLTVEGFTVEEVFAALKAAGS